MTLTFHHALQLVKDVHDYPGHIACDSASTSEIVVPLVDAQGVCGKSHVVYHVDSYVCRGCM